MCKWKTIVTLAAILSVLLPAIKLVKAATWDKPMSWQQAASLKAQWGWTKKSASVSDLKTELTQVKERQAEIANERKEKSLVGTRSEAASRRVNELLSKTEGNVLLVRVDGEATEVAREGLQLEGAIHTIAAASARVELSALKEEATKLTERERELRLQIQRTAVREAAKSLEGVLETMCESGEASALVATVRQ